MMNILSYIILSLVGVSLFLACLNARWKFAYFSVVNRWLKWILFSLLIAYFIRQWDLSERPFFVLITTFFLGWFLVESILIWMNVSALNRSSIALFPRFAINYVEAKWPNLKKFVQLKDFLRSRGFKEIQSIKTNTPNTVPLYALVYKDTTEKNLLQILFFSQRTGIPVVYFILSSITIDGKRYITDNLDMPFGGYMPEGWFKERRPMCDSIDALFDYHLRRCEKSGQAFMLWEGTPLDEINYQQGVLEYYNIKKGFLNPPDLHEDYGKLTSEGRYRLWKQLLFLKYMGISLG